MLSEEKSVGSDIVVIRNAVKHFPARTSLFGTVRSHVHAVDDVSCSIKKGETLGLVGESGCGKTTLGRLVLRLLPITSGQVLFEGKDIFHFDKQEEKKFRSDAQIIFQDSFSSFDSRNTIEQIIGEPLIVHGIASGEKLKNRVAELLETVGLKPDIMKLYPHTLSSGQKQSIGIARSISLDPKFIVADEPISSLDVSVRSQVLNLLKTLQSKKNLTYLFISHDLNVVRWLSNRIAVMYVGKMVEYADAEELFARRYHPYSQALLEAVPITNPRDRRPRRILLGEVPSPVDPLPGCRFAPRCEYVMDQCRNYDPPLLERSPGHWVACFKTDFLGDVTAGG